MLEPYAPPAAQLAGFFHSDGRARALIGPAYGGRKTACIHDILQRVRRERYARQRHWRWLVIGPTRADLDARTIPSLQQWLPVGEWNPKTRAHTLEYRLDDQLERLLEIKFLGLDSEIDRQILKAVEATAVWLDNARLIDEGVFDRACEIAGSFPPRLSAGGGPVGGPVWSGVIASSRMPKAGHWLITRATGFEADIELYRQPGGRDAQAENISNLRARGFTYEWMAAESGSELARIEIDPNWAHRVGCGETNRQMARDRMVPFVIR
jgi:hypothetical protein